MSDMRKRYFGRLVVRILVLIASIYAYFAKPESFTVLEGMNFFREFGLFHVLWLVWMADMLQQVIPIKSKIPLGSQKLFANRFQPIRDKINHEALRQYVVTTTKAAYKVFILWCLLLAAIGLLVWLGVLNTAGVFVISAAFYVCDLICVLIWCPFRLLMKTRCCTTCRIFNWDHWMMFSPFIFAGGFYCKSLLAMSILAWLLWELCVMMYPERFWEKSNLALKCSECTDKLCTQYCQKLRK